MAECTTANTNLDLKCKYNKPIVFHIKSGGPVRNMIKIMNQLSRANRPVIFTYDNTPSVATMIYISGANHRIIK